MVLEQVSTHYSRQTTDLASNSNRMRRPRTIMRKPMLRYRMPATMIMATTVRLLRGEEKTRMKSITMMMRKRVS